MHYDRHYNSKNVKENEAQAIKDTIEWLGQTHFETLVKELKKCRGCELDYLYFGISLVGVEGYPARVLIDAYVNAEFNNLKHKGEDNGKT